VGKRGNSEGSIYQRKSDGRWVGSFIASTGKRKYLYAKTRREVSRNLAEALRAKAEGLPSPDDRLTTGEFLQTWLYDHAAKRVRNSTLKSYEQKVRLHVVPSIGRIRLAKLTPQHVEKMMGDGLAAGIPPSSVRHHRTVLRIALNVAMRWGLVGRNAAALAEPPKVPGYEVRPLSLMQARALLKAVSGERLEALFTVALSVGLRQSEALGLLWDDIDFDTGSLSIRRSLQRENGEYVFLDLKTTRSRRTTPLPGPTLSALRKHRARQSEERLKAGTAWQGERWGSLVFATESGRPLSGFGVTRRFRWLLEAAGLPTMRYHDLRHGAASLMAAQNVPARIAMEILGHAQIGTTMNIYAHVSSDVQREAAERMADALWG